MDVYLDGAPARVGYLGQLRVDPAWRGRRALMRSGYAAVRELRRADEATFDLTAIVMDNAPARRLLEAGLPELPAYRPLHPIVTCVLPTWPPARVPSGPRVERGASRPVEAIVACLDRNARRHQLSRRWTANVLESGERSPGLGPRDFFLAVSHGEVVGCAALWDQRSFKQVVVRRYSRAARALAHGSECGCAPGGCDALCRRPDIRWLTPTSPTWRWTTTIPRCSRCSLPPHVARPGPAGSDTWSPAFAADHPCCRGHARSPPLREPALHGALGRRHAPFDGRRPHPESALSCEGPTGVARRLSVRERTAMLALLQSSFEGATPAVFERDLAEKDWALLLEDEQGLLAGSRP
jgi:hypothetical protein